jgi:ketosteroid isomerase-like protein
MIITVKEVNMVKTNIDIMKTFFEIGTKEGMEAARKVLDDNMEWIEPDVPGLWFSGIHRGAESALREVVKPTFDYVDNFSIKADEYIDADDKIIVLGKFLGTGKNTRKKLDIPFCFVCTVRNGKIIRFRAYHNTALWLDVVGLAMKKAA